jgi:hypothetical protein
MYPQTLALLTWACEVLLAFLTIGYCLIVAHDMHSDTAARFTSPSWFEFGFCVWEAPVQLPMGAGIKLDSHDLCLLTDFIIGGAVLLVSRNELILLLSKQKGGKGTTTACPREAALKLGVVIGVFTMMHGAGHFTLGRLVDEADFMAGLRPAKLLEEDKPLTLIAYALSVTAFLAIAPFMGFLNGVPSMLCSLIHLICSWCYISYVPTQFAFGAVQLILNLWYCVPRAIIIGYTKEKVSYWLIHPDL